MLFKNLASGTRKRSVLEWVGVAHVPEVGHHGCNECPDEKNREYPDVLVELLLELLVLGDRLLRVDEVLQFGRALLLVGAVEAAARLAAVGDVLRELDAGAAEVVGDGRLRRVG